MARSPLILAAVAASAVDGVEVSAVAPLGDLAGPYPPESYDSALLRTVDDRQLVIRAPRTQSADVEQSAELGALRALSPGIRERLPFEVSSALGTAPLGPTRAVILDHLPGRPASLRQLSHDEASSIGAALAAIHSLPTSLITDAGLPAQTPASARRAAYEVIERAVGTGVVPVALEQRWGRAVDDAELWQYSPVVIHGGLSASCLFVAEGGVVGVAGWHALQLGDPARDLAWLISAPGDGITDSAIGSYLRERGTSDRTLRERAELRAELETAQWMLHGMATQSTEIVDDAVEMMSRLVDRIAQRDTGSIRTRAEPLDVSEVESLLDRTQRAG